MSLLDRSFLTIDAYEGWRGSGMLRVRGGRGDSVSLPWHHDMPEADLT